MRRARGGRKVRRGALTSSGIVEHQSVVIARTAHRIYKSIVARGANRVTAKGGVGPGGGIHVQKHAPWTLAIPPLTAGGKSMSPDC